MHIKVEHLSKSIGKTQILHDLNFNIDSCGVIGLLGPNGAGKSTLMKILVGLWHFNQGSVFYRTKDTEISSINGVVPHQITKYIGYLPENNPLYEDMYVREYLMFMLSLSDNSQNIRQKVETLIETVGLTAMSNKHIRQLSKGYRQRVGLAQAISCDPKLLIFDEPTTGLDPNQLDEIRTLIKHLGQDRIVLLSTHILQEVEAMCDRVIILSQGEIREDTTNLNDLETLFRESTRQYN